MRMQRLLTSAFVLLLAVGNDAVAFAQSSDASFIDMSRPLMRGEAVALLVESDAHLKERLAVFVKHCPPMPLFDDVPCADRFAPYVETAFEAGLITGNEARLFRPTALITEEEMISLGARHFAMNHPEMNDWLAAQSGDWFASAVTASLQSNLDLPYPIKLGVPADPDDFTMLLASMGVHNPQYIAITHNPHPRAVIASVTQPRPIVMQPRPTTQPANPRPAPVVTQPTPTQPVVQQPPVAQPPVQQPSQQLAQPAPSTQSFSISMPTLGVKDLTIIHPTDPTTKDGLLAPLKNGVGHLFSYPGKGGTILVYGHSSSYSWDVSEYTKIFRQINKLNPGDLIYITYNGTVHTYKVTYEQTVLATDMSVYGQGDGEELILYTCWPPDDIKERYLVHAKPVTE